MCQQRVEQIKKIILDRLPQDHRKPIKTYKTMQGMLLSIARSKGWTYRDAHMWCQIMNLKYLRNESKNHIHNHVGYYRFLHTQTVPKQWKCLNLIALAGPPIRVCCQMLLGESDVCIAGTILHELGHWYNTDRDNLNNEDYADKYAIRWIRKFIKEGLICERD